MEPASIVTLLCVNAAVTGTLVDGVSATGVSAGIPYTGGNGGSYPGQTVSSTGVTGLTATLPAGNFANGSGSFAYTITGIPDTAGIAQFPLSIGGQQCTLSIDVDPGLIQVLDCANSYGIGTLRRNQSASAVTFAVPYYGGNGGEHYYQIPYASTGVTGLAAVLPPGFFAVGSGFLIYQVSGIPANSGIATFLLSAGGQSCTVDLVVEGCIDSLLCSEALVDTLVEGLEVTGVPMNVPYLGGSGEPYDSRSIQSSGVTGLTADLSPGFYAFGAGSLPFEINGIPDTDGIADFVLEFCEQVCTISIPVIPAAIDSLDCEGATPDTLVAGKEVMDLQVAVPYFGGNGGGYDPLTLHSTGVPGLVATLPAGNFAIGNGNLVFSVSGIPDSSGTASFGLDIGGQSCSLYIVVIPAAIDSLDCEGAIPDTLVVTEQFMVKVPYYGGNGGGYASQSLISFGVTGLTATLPPGNFVMGNDSLCYSVSGTPDTSGTASFGLDIGGQSCIVSIVVEPAAIDSLLCGAAKTTGYLYPGDSAVNASAKVPYLGGNGTAHNGQTVTSTGVSGLTATLMPGNFVVGDDSLTYSITGTPDTFGVALFALDIGGRTCTLEVLVSDCGAFVAPNQWKVFQCHNLGAANTAADPFTPSWEINGGYWQWGRLAMAAAGPTGPASGDANAGAISGWNTSYAPNGAWSDITKTVNDPCPAGFRVPTKALWDGVLAHNPQSIVGSWYESATNYSSGRFFGPNLMLPAAGRRSRNDGTLFYRGYNGYYWSSTEGGSISAWSLGFASGTAYTYGYYSRTYGFSVRCAAE